MSFERCDAALETLFMPWREGLLPWPQQGALFLRARDGGVIREQRWPGLICEQTFKCDADALRRAGLQVVTGEQSPGTRKKYPLVLVLPPRQRDEARALLARAVSMLEGDGRVVACMSNSEGARSGEADLGRLAGSISTLSKNKCRVFWTQPLQAPADAALLQAWLQLDVIRPILGGRFVSRPGLFAWDRVDPASALLASQLPQGLRGRAADLGTGFGYLAAELLARCPGITALDFYDAEQRALEVARLNLAGFAARVQLNEHWHDVTAGLPRSYQVIVCNPPFHAHARTDRPDLGRGFIAAAAAALEPGGTLWLVANRHLPYEAVLDKSFGRVHIVTQAHGYKVVAATRSKLARGCAER